MLSAGKSHSLGHEREGICPCLAYTRSDPLCAACDGFRIDADESTGGGEGKDPKEAPTTRAQVYKAYGCSAKMGVDKELFSVGGVGEALESDMKDGAGQVDSVDSVDSVDRFMRMRNGAEGEKDAEKGAEKKGDQEGGERKQEQGEKKEGAPQDPKKDPKNEPRRKGAAKCRDFNKNCAYWGDMGECEKHPEYMDMACTKSCGVGACKAVKASTKDAQCVDQDHDCAEYAGIGECKTNERYMRKRCKKTCNFCAAKSAKKKGSKECADLDSYCYNLAKMGDCKKNERYMRKNCRKTCKFCTAEDLLKGKGKGKKKGKRSMRDTSRDFYDAAGVVISEAH
jgi:hypothetical protein